MTKIISEIGWNHMGDMERAKDMISSSKQNGADFVKFQTWSVDRLKSGPWDDDGRLEIYKKAELSKEQHIDLYEYSNEVGIPFFTSVFSIKDAELLKTIQTDRVKIASAESRNKNLLEYCDEVFDTIYISTGTSTIEEIKNSVRYLKTSNIVLLHCVSSYPLEIKYCNLPRINELKKICDRVGYSDHTFGVEVSKMSLEYDIEVVEKHFTLDINLPGRDNKFAILPSDMKKLSNYIKISEKVMNDKGMNYQECEVDSRKNYTGRFDG